MKRAILSAAVLGAALMLQLTVVNRLPLPGAGAPDLVLLAVVALGLCSGPGAGAVTGFCAGLALDVAPPGSYLIGEYALVFCLVGYLCGWLRGAVNRSALLTIAAAMAAAAAGEALSAAIGLAVSDPQVTWPAVRLVLPSAIIYDAVLTPFVLYVVVRAVRLVDGLGRAAARPASPPTGPPCSRGTRRRRAPAGLPERLRRGRRDRARRGRAAGRGRLAVGPGRIARPPPVPRRLPPGAAARAPRLHEAAGRHGDGWVGGGPRAGAGVAAAPSGADSPAAARFRVRGIRGRAPVPARPPSPGKPAARRGQPPTWRRRRPRARRRRGRRGAERPP